MSNLAVGAKVICRKFSAFLFSVNCCNRISKDRQLVFTVRLCSAVSYEYSICMCNVRTVTTPPKRASNTAHHSAKLKRTPTTMPGTELASFIDSLCEHWLCALCTALLSNAISHGKNVKKIVH